MKGNNEITLNQATMIAAVQYYFDCVVFKEEVTPVVKSVEAVKSSSSGYGSESTGSFLLKVEEKHADSVPK